MTTPHQPYPEWPHWHDWIECPFNERGEIAPETLEQVLSQVPDVPGLYAISTRTGSPNAPQYHTQYIGQSTEGNNIHTRLRAHLTGDGNRLIKSIIEHKQNSPNSLISNLHITYTTSPDLQQFRSILNEKELSPKVLEALYLDTQDRPLGNLRRERLPKTLRELSGESYQNVHTQLRAMEKAELGADANANPIKFPWQEVPTELNPEPKRLSPE